jgi:16S rRNA (guanine527-N7)-methyltransferase
VSATNETTDHLRRGADALALGLTTEHLARLTAFVELLARWNRRIRLVGPRSERDLIDELILDGLVLARALTQLPSMDSIGETLGPRSVIDVGCGAGLPGITIAILLPSWPLVLCEPNEKKLSFLHEAKRTLSVQATIYEHPVERYLEEAHSTFDHAITRATFEPSVWWPLGRRLVGPSGVVWFMMNDPQPFAESPDWCRHYTLPNGKQRRITGKRVDPLGVTREGELSSIRPSEVTEPV